MDQTFDDLSRYIPFDGIQFVVMPPRSSAWGKFLAPDIRLSLEDHMGDVADCFAALVALDLYRARLATILGEAPSPVLIARLCVIAFLHDVGKLSSAFQAKATDPKARGGHTVQGAHIFCHSHMVEALGIGQLQKWGVGAIPLLLAALAHHGRPVDPTVTVEQAIWKPRDGYDPQDAARRVGAAVRARFPLAFEPPEGAPDGASGIPENAELQHFFAGLVALADQIGSRVEDFPIDRQSAPATPAATVLRNLNIDVAPLRAARRAVSPQEMFGWPAHAQLRPMQQAMLDLPLDVRLAVLEAETGSGKTEAAFLRFERLFAAGLVDGMYFALPTRAAASQIQRRIAHAARACLDTECVLALPGYLRSGDVSGCALPGWQVQWSDDPDRARQEARWSAETSRRFLASAVAVGTIDQVLLGTLQVKWAHFRAASIARSLLVVDEIHSSDPYVRAVLEQIVRDHVARGGHALLMSATLGAQARARLLLGAQAKPERHGSYPALSWADGRRERHVAPGDHGRQKSVFVEAKPWIADMDAIAQAAIEAAQQGAQVLIIRNTVDSVVALQRRIEEMDPQAPLLSVGDVRAPHHSRFAPEDRLSLDRAVEAAMGKGASARAAIVCASQTCEQSLDIDADFLISDLCPIDVLLQRIGRLHRHERVDRPAEYVTARCLVLIPECLCPDPGLLRFGLGPNREGSGVYHDIVGLEAVRRRIGEGATWVIPQDNRALVEAGTDPDTLDALAVELGAAWVAAQGKRIGADQAARQFAKLALLDRDRCFEGDGQDCFPDDARITTRIGADRIEIEFPKGTIGPFGTQVSRIGVPGHWRIAIPEDAADVRWVRQADGSLALPEQGLVYDRSGLRRVEGKGRG